MILINTLDCYTVYIIMNKTARTLLVRDSEKVGNWWLRRRRNMAVIVLTEIRTGYLLQYVSISLAHYGPRSNCGSGGRHDKR
jgi:hypothetical protein